MQIQADRSRLREGKLVRWNADKGFGFIRPNDGGRDIFLHASALPLGQAPEIGTLLIVSVTDDPQGRGQRAVKAVAAGTPRRSPAGPLVADALESPPGRSARDRPPAPTPRKPDRARSGPGPGTGRPRDRTLRTLPFDAPTVFVALLALICLAGAATMVPVTPIPLIAYPVLSLVAYLMYAHDKLSAVRGTWRVAESSLHLAEAAGGWPGAFVAQRTMRHKTVKTSYQVVYWTIVCAHVGFWCLWIFAPAALHGLIPLLPGSATIEWAG